MPQTAVNFILVANEAGLNMALGTIKKEGSMRSALQGALRLSGDTHATTTIHDRRYMQQWGARILADDNVVREGLYEPRHFSDTDFQDGRSWNEWASWKSKMDIPKQQLRHHANTIIYTDGNYKKDTHRAGAGVYSQKDGVVEITIRPSRPEPINTINRADFAALLHALRRWQDCDELKVVIDSQISMQSINAEIRDPNDHKYHVHKNLLKEISDIILERAELGKHSSILKVKYHTGIRGNDVADRLATQAADGDVWNVDMSDDLIGPYDDMFWIKQPLQDNQGSESSEQFLRNLQDCAKVAVHAKHRLGQTNQDTTMVRAWRKVEDEIVQDISCGFWEEEHKVNDATLRNVLKCRFSQVWHMGKAHMFKMPYFAGGPVATSNACPLCGQPDSGSHMLGGCSHREMKKLTIFRHDEAHRLMLNGINKGKMGSFIMPIKVDTQP